MKMMANRSPKEALKRNIVVRRSPEEENRDEKEP